MTSRRVARWALIALIVAIAGCAAKAKPQLSPEDEKRVVAAYKSGEAYYRNHFYEKAAAAYQRVLELDPEGEYADNALYKIAGIHMRRERWEQAVVYFHRLQGEQPKSPYAEEALYNLGFCYFKLGDPNRALDAYEDYLARGDAKNKTRARMLAAQALEGNARYGDALLWYSRAAAGERDRARLVEVLRNAKDLIEDSIPPSDLHARLPDLADGVVTDYVLYRLARDANAAGDRVTARELLAKIPDRRPAFRFHEDAAELAAEIAGAPETRTPRAKAKKDEPAPIRLGVVLPLSGKFRVFGEQALNGVMLGLEKTGVPVEVEIRDSEGDGDTAARHVAELAGDPTILAIVGPLLVKEADTAAAIAEEAEIPLLALSRKEDLVAGRRWVFRNAVTFANQTDALVEYATSHLFARRFAIMYPETDYGEAFRAAFEKSLDPMAHRLEAVTSYAPDATDFRKPSHAILNAGAPDAIFIPDSANRVALIAPQLVYFGIKDVVLLGPSLWNDDTLAKKAGAYLPRSVIVDGFFSRAGDDDVRAFSNKYRDSFGDDPTLLSALGYDAVRLLARAAKDGAADTRSAMRRAILQTRAFPGVAGTVTFLENGEADRSLYLLRVGETEIEERF
ncbi:penicillin-binding protein activator [bacterium]|nr:penicillin-binding protein activator [bacterium]